MPPTHTLEPKIFNIRGQKVVIDADLAMLYGVTTKVFNQAVKRNLMRFPKDFMFQLSKEELENLRSQIVTSSSYGGRRYLPFVFTEHGTIMAASVLNSPRAIEVSVLVARTFAKFRELANYHKEISEKLKQLEKRVTTHDGAILGIIEAINKLVKQPPEPEQKKRPIGFTAKI